MKKLVITDWNTLSMTDDLSTAALQELADVTAYPLTAPEEAAARIGDAELLLCNKTPITAAVLDACPNLKYIGVMATGYNNIDLKAAAQHGITVCNAGSYFAIALCLWLQQHLLHLDILHLAVPTGTTLLFFGLFAVVAILTASILSRTLFKQKR